MLLPILIFIFIGCGVGFVYYYFQQRKSRKHLEQQEKVLQVVRRINSIILGELDYEAVTQKIADAIPSEMNFATGVLAIYDQERKTLRRVAASRTPEAINAIKALNIPFNQIEISIYDKQNLLARAIREKKSFISGDVYDVLGPVLNRAEAAKIQQVMQTKTTLVYPIYMAGDPLGVFIASTSKPKEELEEYQLDILNDFVNGAAIALQHATLYKNIKDKTEQLSFANNRLRELDQAKDDFVSIASHELRTPMTAIRSYVWMALYKSDMQLSEKMTKYLTRVLLSTERLINLVNDMLNISRIDSGKIQVEPKVFEIQELVGEVVVEIEPKVREKGIHIQLLGSNLPKVFADPEKVYQVLLNILGNALKFTPTGGSIIITFFSDGNFLDVSIKDSGVGMLPEDITKLFLKFSRLDNSYVASATSGGTGLGLYISRRLIDLMGGRITASSEGRGKGSTFTFSLPIANRRVLEEAEKYMYKPKEGEVKSLEAPAI